MIPRFVVMSSAAQMPASCWGRYRRVAVIETNGHDWPKQINPRHRTVVRVVSTWEACNVGKTPRCAYERAMRDAQAMADKLNQGEAAL